jgi:hypothetical protein
MLENLDIATQGIRTEPGISSSELTPSVVIKASRNIACFADVVNTMKPVVAFDAPEVDAVCLLFHCVNA